MAKSTQSPLARINRVLRFYQVRTQNREVVNAVYRKHYKS